MGIETALISAGMSAAAAAKTAAVAGTIGKGLSLVSGVSSIVGGFQAKGQAERQAAQMSAQASEAAVERERLAAREARFEQENITELQRRQKLSYLASGVTLEGSPLLAIEETRRRGADNIQEILSGGKAASKATLSEGRLKAQQIKSQGRTDFVSGLTKGATAFGGMLE